MTVSDDSMEFQLNLNRCDRTLCRTGSRSRSTRTLASSPASTSSSPSSGCTRVRLTTSHASSFVFRNPKSMRTRRLHISAALDRYCAANIALNQQVIDDLRVSSGWYIDLSHDPRRSHCLSSARVLVNFLPMQFGGAIAGIVGIAIWVILWDPIYNYFYAWRPNRRDIRVSAQSAELRTGSGGSVSATAAGSFRRSGMSSFGAGRGLPAARSARRSSSDLVPKIDWRNCVFDS